MCVCVCSFLIQVCVLYIYLFEVSVFWNLHQLHLLLLSLDHERLLDVLCGAAVQRHRDHLNNKTENFNMWFCMTHQ